MEPNCCKDNTSKAGTLAEPSPGFQEALFSLTKDDFKLIDTNNSGNLTAQELKSAAEHSELDPAKRAAAGFIGTHVENSKIDATIQGSKIQMASTLPSWHTNEFAKSQLSKDDFKLIDSNGDDILDSKELKTAAKSSTFNAMDKQAINVLGTHLDAAVNDPLFEFKGGVKNWHKEERSILTPAADKNATTPSVDLHLTEEQASGQVSVSKVDDRGNPTEIETSGGFTKIKYDGNNRVTDIETKVAYSPNEKPVINKVVYDDKNHTQTITTEKGSPFESQTKTVNHIGKDGKVTQEDFSTVNDNHNRNVTTKFNENGQIISQITPTDNGGRIESSATYNGDERTSSSSVEFNANGTKIRESTTDLSSRTTNIKKYDENGNPTNSIKMDRSDSKKPTVTDTSFDKDGKVREVNDISYSRPYLVDTIVRKGADGNTISTVVADWKMTGSYGRLNSVQVTDADGETKRLDARSTGEDLKQWKQIEAKMYNHSKPSHHFDHVDEISPGAYQLFVPTNAPA